MSIVSRFHRTVPLKGWNHPNGSLSVYHGETEARERVTGAVSQTTTSSPTHAGTGLVGTPLPTLGQQWVRRPPGRLFHFNRLTHKLKERRSNDGCHALVSRGSLLGPLASLLCLRGRWTAHGVPGDTVTAAVPRGPAPFPEGYPRLHR